MGDMPERVRFSADNSMFWFIDPSCTEYVRADLYDKLADALREIERDSPSHMAVCTARAALEDSDG